MINDSGCYRGIIQLLVFLALGALVASVYGHNVSKEDIAALSVLSGVQVIHYMWLGAKHMVTGYDHLLFLLGVIYYIKKFNDVFVLVSLFALGHSVTLILGVTLSWAVSPYLVDAIIGFSVLYKGFDNLGAIDTFFNERPDERLVVTVFGLFHGLGLATKLQTLVVRDDGLIANLLAFNLGVELGQVVALFCALLILTLMPVFRNHRQTAIVVNAMLVMLGCMLMFYQLRMYYLAA